MEDDQKPRAAAAPSLPWEEVMDLPCSLTATLRIPAMTVGDLVRMELNSVIDSGHPEDSGVPVWVNGVNIGTSEFDVIGDRLIVRITETR